MSSIKFDITGDNSNVLRAFRGVQDGVTQTARIVEQQGQSIDAVFNKIKNAASMAFAGFTAKEIVSTLATIRGEFQQSEIAFETMLGSATKAKVMISDLANLAATTPFDMKGVVSGAKQLLAYGIEADKITETMRRLGDVCAGLGLNLQDIAWLYGTTMTQGRLFSRDLYQFTGRGIPLTEELAKQFGVTKEKVSELVTAGKVGFPEVQKAIWSMTSEGGKFGGLMEKQSKSITGQISNIKDTIEMAINDLGTQTEGVMNTALDITSTVVDHWKGIGEAILAAASAIGLYKAMAVGIAAWDAGVSSVGYQAELSALQAILPLKEEEKKTDLEEAVAKGQLSAAQAELVASKREEAAAYVEELQAKAAAAGKEVIALENKLAMQDDEVQSLQDAYDALNSYVGIEERETIETNLNTAANERNSIARQLQAAREAAATATTEANTAATQLNTAGTARDTAAKGINAQFTLLCQKAQDAWNASMFASPLFRIAVAIVGVTYAVYKLATAETAHEAAIRKSNEAWDEFDNKLKERQSTIESLIRTVQSETASEYEKAEAYQKLSNLAPQLTDQYSQAQLAAADFAKTQKEVAESMDDAKYEQAIAEVKKYKKALEGLNMQFAYDKAHGGSGGIAIQSQIDQAKEDLEQAKNVLANIIELRDQAAENAKPIEVRLKEAQENEEVRQKIFDFYDEAMTLANDWQAANETINFATGETRLDEFIVKAQKDIAGLREDIKKNPADVNLRLQESEKVKVLNNLLSMKQNWAATGATTIPLIFKANWNTAQQSLNQAKTKASALANSGSTESYATAYSKAQREYQAAQRKVAQMEKNKSKYTATQYETATQDLKAAKDAYAKLGGDVTGKSAKLAAKANKDRIKEENKTAKLQEELNNRLKSLQQKNTDEEISLMQEGTEKKLKEIDNDYKKRIAEIDKQEAEFKKKNKEAGKSTALTKEQSDALTKAREIAEASRNSQLDEYYYEQGDSMRTYLKDYGTYQQKRLAIAEEYADKIRKVNESTYTDEQKKWQIASLESERKKNENSLELEAIKQNIDWGSVFGDFGAIFKSQLQPTISKLQELSKQTTDVNEQKTIQELIAKLQGSNTIWDGDVFKKVSDSINAYQDAMLKYTDALEREKAATEDVTTAQRNLADAQSKKDPLGIESAEANLAIAQNNLTEASNDVTKFGNQVQKTTTDLQTASQNAVSQFQQLESGLSGLTSGSLKGIGTSILGLDKLFGGDMQKDVANTLASTFQSLLGKDSKASKALTDALGDTGLAGEIISAMLGILDILKDGASGIITTLIDSVLGAVSGIIDDVFSGNVVMKPLKSIGDNVSHILNAVTFGGFNSLFGGDGNAKKVNKTIEDLTSRNEKLQQSIEDLTDAMEKSYGSKATDYYEQAKKNQEETNKNYLDIAKAQAGYHASHHSWNSYWGGFTKDEMDWIKRNVKSDFNGDLFSLSPEEMKLLRGNVSIWERIENTGKGGYGERLTEKLNDYIDQAGKLEELTDKMKESLTQISFDSMKDSFVSNLMDMNKSASDFADDFAEMMQKALLSYSMEDLINGDLKNLYDDWAKLMKENNGKFSQSDIDAFNKRYDEIVSEGLKRRDEWSKVTGYTGESSSQSATSGGWQSMGQETADELNGRFTALQIAGETIANNMATNVAQMETIVNLGISTNGAVLEIRNMMIMTNSYLEDIVKYAKLSYSEFGTKMDDMVKNLKKI